MRLAHLLKPALCAAAAVSFAACSKSDSGNTAQSGENAGSGAPAAGTADIASDAPGATPKGEFNGSYTETFPKVQTIAMRANYAGNVQDASAGRQAFLKYNCVGCHGGLAGGAMGPSLRDDEWKYGGTDEQILNTLHNGRPGGMPGWKGKIPDPELKQIIAYIRSMRTPQEPTYFFTANDADQNKMTAFLTPGPGGNAAPAATTTGGQPTTPPMPAGAPATTKGQAAGTGGTSGAGTSGTGSTSGAGGSGTTP
jgi:cytochrome c oxidase cbb3-type subunit 3